MINVPTTQHLNKLWMRAGMTIELTDAEVKELRDYHNDKSIHERFKNIVFKAVKEERVYFDGNTYFPVIDTNACLSENEEMEYDFQLHLPVNSYVSHEIF